MNEVIVSKESVGDISIDRREGTRHLHPFPQGVRLNLKKLGTNRESETGREDYIKCWDRPDVVNLGGIEEVSRQVGWPHMLDAKAIDFKTPYVAARFRHNSGAYQFRVKMDVQDFDELEARLDPSPSLGYFQVEVDRFFEDLEDIMV